jgi:hypothetical protein
LPDGDRSVDGKPHSRAPSKNKYSRDGEVSPTRRHERDVVRPRLMDAIVWLQTCAISSARANTPTARLNTLPYPHATPGQPRSLFILASIAAGFPVILEFLATGLVPRFPTTILAVGLMIVGIVSQFSGLILDSVAKGRREAKLLAYLTMASVPTSRSS